MFFFSALSMKTGIVNFWLLDSQELSCLTTKPAKWSVCPAKTRISLGESSLYAQWVVKDPSFLHAWVAKDPCFLHTDSEGSDQTGQMPRLIWVFAGRTGHYVGFVMRRISCFVLLIYLCTLLLHEPCHEKNCLRSCATGWGSDWSA